MQIKEGYIWDSNRTHRLGILNFSSSSLSLGSQTLMQILLYSFSTQVTLLYIYLFIWMTLLSQVPTPILFSSALTSWHKDFQSRILASCLTFSALRFLPLHLVCCLLKGATSLIFLPEQKSLVQNLLLPLVIDGNLTLHSGTTLTNCTEYRTLVGNLQYLSLTCPDISYVVNKLSQFMYHPTFEHWNVAKRLLRYLCGTLTHGLFLHKANTLSLHAFSNAD